jgi:signal peptidase I
MRISLIIALCAAGVILLLMLFLNQAFATQNIAVPDLNAKNNGIYVQVMGKSMEPTIAESSILKCEKEQTYGVGNVVAFQSSNKVISHRIIGELFGMFITKGDGNPIPDIGLVSKENVLCKIIL